VWKHWKAPDADGEEIAVERRRSLTAVTDMLWKVPRITSSHCGKAKNVTTRQFLEPGPLESNHAREKRFVPINGRYEPMSGCFQARARSCPQPRVRGREYQRPPAPTITRVRLSTGIPRADAGFSTVSTDCGRFSTTADHHVSPAQTRQQTPVRLERSGGRGPATCSMVWKVINGRFGFDTPQDARI